MIPHAQLVTPEVVQKIRSDNRALLERTDSIKASLETGRFDDAAPMAAELGHVLCEHILLVDGVLDVLSLDDITPTKDRR